MRSGTPNTRKGVRHDRAPARAGPIHRGHPMTSLDLRPPRMHGADPALTRYAKRLSTLRGTVAATAPTIASHRWRLRVIEGLLAQMAGDLGRWRK